MATKKIKRFQEGGVSDKDRGLEASKDDKVSFFERLRMGNIDEEGSEAYRRFGAGRGKTERTLAERTLVKDTGTTPTVKESAPEAPKGVIATPIPVSPAQSKMDAMEKANASAPIAVPAGPRASGPPAPAKAAPARSTPAKAASAKPAVKRPAVPPMTGKQPTTATYTREGGPTEKELQDYQSRSTAQKFRDKTKISPALAASLGLGAGFLGKKAIKAGAPKVKTMLDARKARKVAETEKEKAKQATAEKTRVREKRELDTLLRDLKTGQAKTKFTSESKKPSKRTKKFNDSESNVEFKRGGSVAKASKRADGIATRGKTRCKIR